MRLKISTPERVVYQGEIKSVSLPTENWILIINPNQTPMVTAIKPWLIKIIPFDMSQRNEYVVSKNEIVISCDKWMVFVDWKIIRVVSSHATTSPNESSTLLEKRKEILLQEIRKLKSEWAIEELEKMLSKLQKVEADISLEKIKQHW